MRGDGCRPDTRAPGAVDRRSPWTPGTSTAPARRLPGHRVATRSPLGGERPHRTQPSPSAPNEELQWRSGGHAAYPVAMPLGFHLAVRCLRAVPRHFAHLPQVWWDGFEVRFPHFLVILAALWTVLRPTSLVRSSRCGQPYPARAGERGLLAHLGAWIALRTQRLPDAGILLLLTAGPGTDAVPLTRRFMDKIVKFQPVPPPERGGGC